MSISIDGLGPSTSIFWTASDQMHAKLHPWHYYYCTLLEIGNLDCLWSVHFQRFDHVSVMILLLTFTQYALDDVHDILISFSILFIWIWLDLFMYRIDNNNHIITYWYWHTCVMNKKKMFLLCLASNNEASWKRFIIKFPIFHDRNELKTHTHTHIYIDIWIDKCHCKTDCASTRNVTRKEKSINEWSEGGKLHLLCDSSFRHGFKFWVRYQHTSISIKHFYHSLIDSMYKITILVQQASPSAISWFLTVSVSPSDRFSHILYFCNFICILYTIIYPLNVYNSMA